MSDGAKPSRKDFWIKLLYVLILVFSIIFLILGFELEQSKPLTKLRQHIHLEGQFYGYIEKVATHLATEIGIAGLIVCGLAATIERLSAKEFINLAAEERNAIREESKRLAADERRIIKDDIFRAVYGSIIPEDITDEIVSQVLKAKFVRENVIMIYTLRPVLNRRTRKKYILVELEMSYDVKNLTSVREHFPLAAFVETAPAAELIDEAKFISLTVTGCETPFKLSGESLQTKQTDFHVELNIEREVWISGGSAARIALHTQTVKSIQGGSDYFRFAHHTCDLDLTVHVMNEQLKVYADTFSESQQLAPTERHRPDDDYYNWKAQRPILAFQGIYVTWMPVKQEADIVPNPAGGKQTHVTDSSKPQSTEAQSS